MKRILHRAATTIAAIIGFALLIACGVVIWVAGTESGLQFVWQRVSPRLPDGVEVEALEGRLAGPLELRGVSLRTATLEVRVEVAELEWLASALPTSLDIERLYLRGVEVIQIAAENVPPPAPDGAPPVPERIELPFDINVDEAVVETLRYRSSPEAEALLIERVALEGRLDEDELLVRELAVRGPLLDATARARIVPHDGYEMEGELEWVLRYAQYPDAHGSTRFAGALDRLTIAQRIEAPYNASAEVVVWEPLTALRFDGTLAMAVQPAELGIGLPNSTVGTELSFGGTLDNVDLRGTVELSAEQVDKLEAKLHAQYAGGALQIDSLDVIHPASAATLGATGTVTLVPALALDVRSSWSGLQWPLRDRPLARSESGALDLRGTLDEYALVLDAALAGPNDAHGRVRLAGTGNLGALTLEQIAIEALEGRVDGRGDVTWRPEIGISLALTGRDLDPGSLASDWRGRLGATVRAAATVDGQNVTVRVDELTVDGELRDRPIEGSARGQYSLDTLRLEALALRSGATRADASGTAGSDVALQWRIDSPDLGDLWPGLAGAVTASGTFDGPRMQPHVRVDARGEGLSYRASEVGGLGLHADVDLAGRAQSRVDLSLRAAELQGTQLEQLELHGAGNAERHELELGASGDIGAAQIALVGVLERPWRSDFVWAFDLDTATLAYATLSPWQLSARSSGRVSAAHAELARTCWQSDAADLCVDGALRPDRTEAHFAVAKLPFAYFAAAFVEPVHIEGELSAEGAFEQRAGGSPQLDVELESSLGRVVSADSGAVEPYSVAFGPIDGRVTTENDRMTGELTVPLEQRGELEVEARIGAGAGAPFAERSLDGSLRVDIEDLDFAAHVLDTLQNTGGTLGGDMRFSGTVGDPRVDGRIALENGKATVRATNTVLEDLGLVVTSEGGGEITIEADGRSGGGSVRAEGAFAVADGGPLGRITLRGEGFEVIDTRDAQVLVSPDLAFAVAPDRLELTGSVTVPQARLTPRENQPSAVTASADQVIVTEENDEGRGMGRPLHANVELRLGDDVDLRGYGLEGSLGGSLKIIEKPGEPITGSGELRVNNGKYDAYGQKLDVATGRLLFAGGPIEQPGLDVEAVRRPAEGILVGARVRGTLKSPELTVFSQPTMPQQEQLSYLVLGRPLQSASASEASAMSRAALALGLKGGNFVSERINENLGLDEFGIQTDPNKPASEASFVIGKYLSPSLYVSYGIGIFEPVNTLRLRYTISGRWELVTESSSEASGGDVIYNIERK